MALHPAFTSACRECRVEGIKGRVKATKRELLLLSTPFDV
jgi:hypothetical protein